jgi:hypothetical protein
VRYQIRRLNVQISENVSDVQLLQPSRAPPSNRTPLREGYRNELGSLAGENRNFKVRYEWFVGHFDLIFKVRYEGFVGHFGDFQSSLRRVRWPFW